MADESRIDDLRRRVQQDPASIAFAQLGEELRRADLLEEAVAVCRAGLVVHPTYHSARVTLGRALLALNRLDDAEAELSMALAAIPGNLSALRALGEIHQRHGRLTEALADFESALAIARNDPDLQEKVAGLARQIEPREAARSQPVRVETPDPAAAPVRPARVREQRTIEALEQWLDAINVARANQQP